MPPVFLTDPAPTEIYTLSLHDALPIFWKRFNKINVHFALEPSYTNWAVFPDTFPDGDWHWRPGFNPAAVQTVQLLDRSMDQGRVGDALKVNYVEADGKVHLRVTFEYCEG